MTLLRPQLSGIPVPRPSAFSLPYWEGCRLHELRHQRCQACGAINPKPSSRCSTCQQPSLAWQVGAGVGTLYSWTVVWRPQHPSFEVPYAPAVVHLDEGYWLLSAVIGCDSADLRADMRLAVDFHPASDDIVLAYFRPAPVTAASTAPWAAP